MVHQVLITSQTKVAASKIKNSMAYSLHCYFSITRKCCLNHPAPAVLPSFPSLSQPKESYWAIYFNLISFSLGEHFPHTLYIRTNRFSSAFLFSTTLSLSQKLFPEILFSHRDLDNPSLKHKYSYLAKTLLAFPKHPLFLSSFSGNILSQQKNDMLSINCTSPALSQVLGIVICLVSSRSAYAAQPNHSGRWGTALMWLPHSDNWKHLLTQHFPDQQLGKPRQTHRKGRKDRPGAGSCHGININTGLQRHSQNWNLDLIAVETRPSCLKYWSSARTSSVHIITVWSL